MCAIGSAASGLERRGASFTVESLAKELRQEWVEEALRETGRESVRERLLPATLTAWLVILMGLHRRTSYVNLLYREKAKLAQILGNNDEYVKFTQEADKNMKLALEMRKRVMAKQ